jgi:hypothetical protein
MPEPYPARANRSNPVSVTLPPRLVLQIGGAFVRSALETPMLTGGCFCGEIRYEADGTPFHETNCHCSICRRTTGAPFVTWFSVRRSDFWIVKGQPARFNSTKKGIRSFCSRCGTQLSFEHADFTDEIDVTTSSLDDPESVPPRDNTHTSSRLRWFVPDGRPEYQESRE